MMKIGYRAMAVGVAALAGAAMSLATAAPPKAAYDAERVLYSFGTINDGQATIDGANPYGSLILVNGSLYGTTYLGGSVNCSFSNDRPHPPYRIAPGKSRRSIILVSATPPTAATLGRA